ncbi:hypothetical protein HMPREF1631_03335 [Arcanobacterium sp. S3PF19]|nr:hypothetical protein HMPREF1631_03335 [Arcanobacterium sp. S3PF19]
MTAHIQNLPLPEKRHLPCGRPAKRPVKRPAKYLPGSRPFRPQGKEKSPPGAALRGQERIFGNEAAFFPHGGKQQILPLRKQGKIRKRETVFFKPTGLR